MIKFNLDRAEAAGQTCAGGVSVFGIGGAGTNVVDKMALEGVAGVDLVSMNCAARALQGSLVGTKLQLGKKLTQGLGCGGDPELGAEAAQASREEIAEVLGGRGMVFLCVGLGGGTGSGAAPLIARQAREAGAFVVVFATLPFSFEGRRRCLQASLALQELEKYANALVTFENDRMGELVVPKKGVQEAFEQADRLIGQSVRAVAQLVSQPGLIRIGLDELLAALRHEDSRCLFGYGQAKGPNRAAEALAKALQSPLLDRGQMLAGARQVLVHICGGASLTLLEMESLMGELGGQIHPEAQILFGAGVDAKLQDVLSVTILTSLGKPIAAEVVAVVAAEPVAESVAEPVAESAAAVVAEPVAAELVVEAEAVAVELFAPFVEEALVGEAEVFAAEPEAELAEAVAESAAEPVVEAVAEPVIEPVIEPVAEPVAEWVSEVEAVEAVEAVRPVKVGRGKAFGLSDIVQREVKAVPVPEVAQPQVAQPQVALPQVVAAAVPVRPFTVASRSPQFDKVEPIRPIAVGRGSGGGAAGVPAAKGAAAARPLSTEQQTFDERLTAGASGGRFDRVTPTVEEGEDLDVPTFLRRKR